MEWFEDQNELKNSIEFIMHYDCCVGWNALLRKKTPCCDYSTDISIPPGLEEAISEFINNLTKSERLQLNRRISMVLGECYYVKKTIIVKMLSRLLADGNPCANKDVIKLALENQIRKRMYLLKELQI